MLCYVMSSNLQAKLLALQRFAAQCEHLPFFLDGKACEKLCVDGYSSRDPGEGDLRDLWLFNSLLAGKGHGKHGQGAC